MLTTSIFLFFIFNLSFVYSQIISIKCYHGEGLLTGSEINKNKTRDCVSGKCILFLAPCGNYWSTTCYEENSRMTVISAFKDARKYYKKSPQTTSLLVCTKSYCNNDTIHIRDPFYIQKDPMSSFDDSLLSKNTRINKKKQPKINKMNMKLQNRLLLASGGLNIYETFKFIGQTFNDTRKVWIEFGTRNYDGSTERLKLILNLHDSTITEELKTYKKKFHSEKNFWSNMTIPGECLNVTLKSYILSKKNLHEIIINNESYGYFDWEQTQKIMWITYGGKMILVGASVAVDNIYNFGLNHISIPMFYPSLLPPSSKKISNTHDDFPIPTNFNKTKITITSINWKTNHKNLTISLADLNPNEMKNYELRESGKLESNLLKIQIQFIPKTNSSSSSIYQFFFWTRKNSIWVSNGVKRTDQCDNMSLSIPNNDVIVIQCNNKWLNTVSYVDAEEKVKILVENFKKNGACS